MHLQGQAILIIRADMATFLSVGPMPIAEANDYVQKWLDGKLPPKFGGAMSDGRKWAFASDKVALMHVESLENVQAMQQQQRAQHGTAVPPTRWGMSGGY